MRARAHHKALALLWCSGLSSAAAPPNQKILPRQTPAPTTAAVLGVSAVTGCHIHGSQLFCIDANGEDVQVGSAEAAKTGHDNDDDGEDAVRDQGLPNHRHCHFHAGVEHCVGGDEPESRPQCSGAQRNYNVPLRIGLLFAILATSALGVFGPILLQRFLPHQVNTIFIVLKQFGTGIIVSTAFVHLYTHASLMFGNKCLGELSYEATTSAILMAGLFLSFLVEFVGQRIILARISRSAALSAEQRAGALLSTEVVSILVMEAGILFHSLLIGLTLVVAGDSFFITLFVVILFHQVFEGVALGTRIATVGNIASESVLQTPRSSSPFLAEPVEIKTPVVATTAADAPVARVGLTMKKKLGLAALFAFVTPIGMSIGIGVLHKFNGNDKSTLIAIGTLDALSADILVWVGVVEMWAADWMTGGHGHGAALAHADMLTVVLAGLGLVAGMALMSLLGKWA